jgi:Ca2+-binding EF-hand superfamily protein
VACWEQRVCLNILVNLSIKEKPHNIREPILMRADGTQDPLPLGVPRSWEKADGPPATGRFSCFYICAPEHRAFETRRAFTEKYSFFPVNVVEREVMWWTGLTEPPSDVIDFLEFLIGEFNNHNEVFEKLLTVGTDVVTLRQFTEGLLAMNCQKFKGKDEQQRIASVFRYLDPGGEGSVSLEEWDIMGQLWKEFDLSIREFVQFLERTFKGDLAVAWDFLDDDGSGELTEEEWMSAVQAIGYFGPSRVVFALLDNSDDGNISLDEFEVLEKYKV